MCHNIDQLKARNRREVVSYYRVYIDYRQPWLCTVLHDQRSWNDNANFSLFSYARGIFDQLIFANFAGLLPRLDTNHWDSDSRPVIKIAVFS